MIRHQAAGVQPASRSVDFSENSLPSKLTNLADKSNVAGTVYVEGNEKDDVR
jgi:hypothetical protein